MAANQINGSSTISFDLLEGDLPAAAEAVELFARPGLDGYETLRIGKRTAAGVLRGVKWSANESDAETHLAACFALAGQIVTVDNAWNRDRSNVLVEEVRFGGGRRGGDDPKRAVIKDGGEKVQTTVLITARRLT